jgi:hypothetical protein
LFFVTRLVAVNADGSEMQVLLQRQVEGNYSQFLDAIVDWLVDDPRRVLVELPNMMPGSVDVYRRAHASSRGFSVRPVDIYSGDTGSPVETQSGLVSWISDGRGSPRLCRRMSEHHTRWKYRRSGEPRLLGVRLDRAIPHRERIRGAAEQLPGLRWLWH